LSSASFLAYCRNVLRVTISLLIHVVRTSHPDSIGDFSEMTFPASGHAWRHGKNMFFLEMMDGLFPDGK